jgi:His/Glu/Gln/Arg/opine family amino acid ABC transporter permease subunit
MSGDIRTFNSFIKKILELERGVAGRSRWDNNSKMDVNLSLLCLVFSVLFSSYMLITTKSSITIGGEVSSADALIYSSAVAVAWLGVSWVILISVIKRTRIIPKIVPLPWFGSTALLGIISSFIMLFLVEWVFDVLVISMRWDIVWANRVSVMLGPNLTEAMTQDYLVSENWRIWPIIFLLWGIVGSAYGTSGTSTRSYLIGFGVVSAIILAFAGNPLEANYNIDRVLFRFILATVLSLCCFFAMRYYSNNVEEYKLNRAKKYIGYAAISTFFLTIILLDPPEFIKNFAAHLVGFGIFESQLELITRDGVPPARWGGLLINLIVAAAGCVLGFAIGVILAFSRQSTLPVLKWPGVAVIEIVRSGPLICWLYFAMYLLPDIADPLFTNPEDFDNIVRMMAIFSLFGGCYIAEVIRGGLQAVDSGQKEAALALGLSPIQIKLQIELPNAVRTTLPSIVSVFIGLWKDTTLLFIIEIVDFFRISKTMANTDLRFLGDFLEPVYFTALVFWVFAFYLSRVSMNVEKGLGLVKEGGGDAA